MIKLVIFDWNGTLLDDLEGVFGSVLEIFRRYGVTPPTIEQYRAEITADFMQFYWAHGIPRTATADDLNAIRIEVLKTLDPHAYPLREHAPQVLAGLKGKGCGVAMVSAGNREIITTQLGHYYIADFFDLVITDARDKKKALADALSHFGVSPPEAIYVDDTFDGLHAARAAGLWAFGILEGYNSAERIRQAYPHFVIHGLAEIFSAMLLLDISAEAHRRAT